MEREIIFRGKRIDNGEWIEGNLLVMGDDYWIVPNYKNASTRSTIEIIAQTIVRVEKETVGQYTGFKDKNENRIFDGDVLHCVSDDCEYDYKTKVYCCGNTICVDIVGQEGSYTAIDFAYDYWDNENCNVEIIGNIHDNPGLSEV